MRRTNVFLIIFGLSICPVLAGSDESSGSLWIHNAKTANGRNYLLGFVRGYIEGKKWGLDLIEGVLPDAQFDAASRIEKKQIESKLFMETLYYARALEEEKLEKTVDEVTQWYQDPQNQTINWTKLVELAIGRVNGVHLNYIQYQLKWLQDASTHGRIDWFHTIDPATGEGRVNYYDKEGRITRTELVR